MPTFSLAWNILPAFVFIGGCLDKFKIQLQMCGILLSHVFYPAKELVNLGNRVVLGNMHDCSLLPKCSFFYVI